MAQRDDRVCMMDMLSHAREAVAMLGARNRAELEAGRMLQLALTRLVEIVGEAANRVSRESQERYSQLPWPQIIGMRNRLVHGYDILDLDVLWETVQTDLPPLIAALETILEREK